MWTCAKGHVNKLPVVMGTIKPLVCWRCVAGA